MHALLPWVILTVHILLLLIIDFAIFAKRDHSKSYKIVLYETLFFVANALLFGVLIYYFFDQDIVANVNDLSGTQAVFKYLTGYTVELSLSVDNLFVMAMIFTNYKIPREHQHKLLFLGIFGAIVLRAVLIGLGIALIHQVEEATILFGAFLLYTALKMFKSKEKEKPPSKNWFRKWLGISDKMDGGKFRTTIDGKRVFTSLFGALIMIEFTDLLFALDSIPAVFAITTDPFIVYSSNIFAIMGLRSLYFLLANMLDKFHYLKYSVFVILIFVSVKLITAMWIEIPEWISLGVILGSLTVGVLVSILRYPK